MDNSVEMQIPLDTVVHDLDSDRGGIGRGFIR